jgi:ribosome-binding protein aMBF1 (putative translation factor)
MDLKEARFKKGISQWGLRMQTGINQTKICLIEKGYVTPTDEEKGILAKALGVEAPEIIWPEVPFDPKRNPNRLTKGERQNEFTQN